MDGPRISVVIVSHGRPALLRRAVLGVSQLYHRPSELIVVADAEGLSALSDLGIAGRIKTAEQTEANISAARNQGVALAAGEIIAFLDDDAVPEPSWLCHLAKAFENEEVVAAAGLVLGRNGISRQWGPQAVSRTGQEIELSTLGEEPHIPLAPEGFAPKLHGTNMGIRAAPLRAMGGFDPAYRFFLDETDLAMRLWRAGHQIAYVPRAVMHHGFAPSARRHASRAPRSLWEIGASTAVFLRKHADPSELDPNLLALRETQRQRLDRFLRNGDLQPRDIGPLISDLDRGISEGREVALAPPHTITSAPPEFQPLVTDAAPKPVYLSGRWFQVRARQAEAARLAREGHATTLFLFAPTFRRHQMRFTSVGYWVQSGGLWGRSDRDGPRPPLGGFQRRLATEIARVRRVRDQI